MRYLKQALTFDAQIDLLASRGLIFADHASAVHTLARISYYRLSAYWHPFKRHDDTFEPGTYLETVVRLYELDRHLRLQVMDSIERIEIALRTAMTYTLCHAFGPYGHCNPANFRANFDHKQWLAKAHIEAQQSREEFVQHFRRKYDGFPDLPLWMATETLPFGSLSRLYAGMRADEQRSIAADYCVHHDVLRSWLHALAYVRNICAHHARLWNRELAIAPELPRRDPRWCPPMTPTNRRVFAVLLVLRQMMAHHRGGGHWQRRVSALIETADLGTASRVAMGLPEGWVEHPLWNRQSAET